MISAPFKSLITYVHGIAFFTFLITNISADQLGVYPLTKIFVCFDILIWSPTFNVRSLSLISLSILVYVLSLTSKGLNLIVLWYVLLYSFTISSMKTFFILQSYAYKICFLKF